MTLHSTHVPDTINVNLSASYTIYLGVDFMEGLARAFASIGSVSKKIIICDELLAAKVGEKLSSCTDVSVDHVLSIPGGESAAKTRPRKEMIEDELLQIGIDRKTVLVAIGGGSIGDLVGFVAATLLRGVRYIQVPTTVLSIADSSVGGKTAVNTISGGKNMIGAFHQPSAVVVDFGFLESLPDRHWSNGMAEIIKAAFVMKEPELFGILAGVTETLGSHSAVDQLKADRDLLRKIFFHSICYKARIVEQDERETTGIRAQLNFGHSIGHALEMTSEVSLMSNPLLHGQCVAVGMVHELLCLKDVGFMDELRVADIKRLKELLTLFGLPTTFPSNVDLELFEKFIRNDKKGVAVSDSCVKVPIVAMRYRGDLDRCGLVCVPLKNILRVVSPWLLVNRGYADCANSTVLEVTVPGSKSIANRVLLLQAVSAMKNGILSNLPVDAEDVNIMAFALQQLGVEMTRSSGGGWMIKSPRELITDSTSLIHVGNSGTSMRFLFPMVAVLMATRKSGRENDASHQLAVLMATRENGEKDMSSPILSVLFECDPRMSERPNKDLIQAVLALCTNLEIAYLGKEFCVPFRITRHMARELSPVDNIAIDGSVSSQFVSGLLMASPFYPVPFRVHVAGKKLVSKQYVDMTMRLMNTFGVSSPVVEENSPNGSTDPASKYCVTYHCSPGEYNGQSLYAVPGDASAGSYPAAIAALTGTTVSINIVDDNLQGDYQFINLLENHFLCTVRREEGKTVVTGKGLAAIQAKYSGAGSSDTPSGPQLHLNMYRVTDTFLTAAVLMAAANVRGSITDVANQRVKECDRIAAMASNLSTCGYNVKELCDGLEFGTNVGDAKNICAKNIVHTHKDHRIAMAFAVLAAVRQGLCTEDPGCVEKTFPAFWNMVEEKFGLSVRGTQNVEPETIRAQPVVLVGMRGIGKSTLGSAFRCGQYEFICLDEEIEKTVRVSLREFIETAGWDKFRAVEAMTFRNVLNRCENSELTTVIGTGGGIVEGEGSRALLEELHRVVWIRTQDDETTVACAEAVQGPAYKACTAEVYQRRKPWYARVAKYQYYVDRRGNCDLQKAMDRFYDFVGRLIGGTQKILATPPVGSTFVCVTAESYAYWGVAELRRATGGPHPPVTAIEIRVDRVKDLESFFARDVWRLKKFCAMELKLELLLTCRSDREGGACAQDEYWSVVRDCLASGCADWVDIEVDRLDERSQKMEELIKQYKTVGGVRFISSHHSSLEASKVSRDRLIRSIKSVVEPSWSDMGKIVYAARSEKDCSCLRETVAEIPRDSTKPVIAVCTGVEGLLTRIKNAVWTPVCSSDPLLCGLAAPGQVTAEELALLRKKDSRNPNSLFQFHLFGKPIGKSPSPFMHNLLFRLRDLPAVYARTETDDIGTVVSAMTEDSTFRGASVTIPLKESVFAYLADNGGVLTEQARLAGAVNTICRSVDQWGRTTLKGYNTDILALVKIFEKQCKPTISSCVVVGTGGAARAAIVAAISCPLISVVSVVGRDPSKVALLTKEFGLQRYDPADRFDVIVCCVPADAQIELLTQFPHLVHPQATVVEMAYIPKVTPILETLRGMIKSSSENNSQVVFGSEVLLLQGIAQHELWTDSLIGEVEPSCLRSQPVEEELLRAKFALLGT